MTDLDRFNKFISIMQTHYPSMTVKYKDESTFMQILGKILFFNKAFMKTYATTIGKTVYLPTRKIVEEQPLNWLMVVAHECVHINDYNRLSAPLFSFLYLAPQLLFLLLPIAAIFCGWWALLFLLFLGPLPSPGRMYLEKRGYSMTLFMIYCRYKELGISEENTLTTLKNAAANIDKNYFAGSAYYFMWPFGMKSRFDNVISSINSADISNNDEVFAFARDAFEKSKQ